MDVIAISVSFTLQHDWDQSWLAQLADEERCIKALFLAYVKCDQMLEIKVAQIFLNVAQKVALPVLTLEVLFAKIAHKVT